MSVDVIDQVAIVFNTDAPAELIVTESGDAVIAEVDRIHVLQVDAPSLLVAEIPVTTMISVSDMTQVVVQEVERVTIIAAGNQGPQGINGLNGSGAIEFPFSYGDASPANVVIAPAGKMVYGVQVHIDVPFDGAGAALSIGDAGQADRLMAASENDPLTAASYTAAPVHEYGTDTQITLSITPGAGASQGAGLITIFIQQ